MMRDEDIKKRSDDDHEEMRGEVRRAYANGYEDGVKAALRYSQRNRFAQNLGGVYIGTLANEASHTFLQDWLDGRR